YLSIKTITAAVKNDTINSCGSYTYNGILYTSSIVVKDTVKSAAPFNCDSIYNSHYINIRNITPVVKSDTVNSCGGYSYNGTLYTTSTLIKDTVKSAAPFRCDSIYNNHYINIKDITPVAKNDTINSCGSYTYNGTVYTS